MEIFRLFGSIFVKDQASSEIDNVDKKAGMLSGNMKKLAGVIGAAFSVAAIAKFGKECLDAASDVEEMENKFKVVFDGMDSEVDEWAGTFSDAIGRNKNEIKTYLADNQNMFVGMGMTREAGAKMSKQLVSTALDLASFNNLNESEAVERMSKAIMGESEAAKGLGAVLNDNTRAMAMEALGFKGKFANLTEAQKMEVNYQAILMQSTDAIGDAERSSGSYANQVRRLSAKYEEFTETLGAIFLPIATEVVKFLSDGVSYITGFTTKLTGAMDTAKKEFEDTGEYVNFFSTLFEEMFGFTLPEQVWWFVDDMITGFFELWTRIQSLWDEFAVPLFDIIKGFLSTVGEHADVIFEAISQNFNTAVEIMKGIWDNIGKPIFDLILLIVGTVADFFADRMPAIAGFFKQMSDDISVMWTEHLQPCFQAIGDFITNVLAPAFEWVFNNIIGPIIDGCFKGIIDLWNNSLKPIFENIIDFITNVFTGNWSAAWENVIGILKGIWDGAVAIIKVPFNAIIGMVNKLIDGINSFEVPDFIPFIGGASANIPRIPMLYKGTDYFTPNKNWGNMALVGEQGPELVELPTGAKVNTAQETNDRLGGYNNNDDKPIQIFIDGKMVFEALNPYMARAIVGRR